MSKAYYGDSNKNPEHRRSIIAAIIRKDPAITHQGIKEELRNKYNIDIHVNTVGKDHRILQGEWRERSFSEIVDSKIEQVRLLDRTIDQALISWENSKQGTIITNERKDAKGKVLGTTTVTRHSHGDYNYLKLVVAASDQKAKVLQTYVEDKDENILDLLPEGKTEQDLEDDFRKSLGSGVDE